MNRTEFNETLEQICADVAKAGGNMAQAGKTALSPEDIRYIAAVALMAADRYYSNLTKLDYQRRQNDPLKKGGQ